MSTKKANLILTTCSMAWGTSYIFMKLGIEGLSPLMLMALRTGIAFLLLVLIFFKRLPYTNPLWIKYHYRLTEWLHPQHNRCACSDHSCHYFPKASGTSCPAWNHYRIDRNGADQRWRYLFCKARNAALYAFGFQLFH